MNYEIGDLVRCRTDGKIGIIISTDVPQVTGAVRVKWTSTIGQRNFYKGALYQLERL